METREERFEAMLREVQQRYDEAHTRLEALRAEGKTKTATYRELMGDRLLCRGMLDLYARYGLL